MWTRSQLHVWMKIRELQAFGDAISRYGLVRSQVVFIWPGFRRLLDECLGCKVSRRRKIKLLHNTKLVVVL